MPAINSSIVQCLVPESKHKENNIYISARVIRLPRFRPNDILQNSHYRAVTFFIAHYILCTFNINAQLTSWLRRITNYIAVPPSIIFIDSQYFILNHSSYLFSYCLIILKKNFMKGGFENVPFRVMGLSCYMHVKT